MRYGLSLSEVSHLDFSTVILNASHLFWVCSLCWTDFWQSSPHIFTLLDSNPKRMILNLIGCLWTIFPCQRVIRSQDMGAAIIFADCRIVYEATNNPSGLIYWTWQPFTLAPCLREQHLTSCLYLCLNIPMTWFILPPLIISQLIMHYLLACRGESLRHAKFVAKGAIKNLSKWSSLLQREKYWLKLDLTKQWFCKMLEQISDRRTTYW